MSSLPATIKNEENDGSLRVQGAQVVQAQSSDETTPGITLLPSVTRNSAIAMIGGIVSQGLKFLVVIYIARHFPVSDFGLLSFAIAVNAYIFVVSSFGLPIFGSRAVAMAGYVSRSLLAEIFCLRAVLALAATIVSVGVLAVVPGVGRTELLLVAIFGLSNVALAGLFDWAFQGLHRQEACALQRPMDPDGNRAVPLNTPG